MIVTAERNGNESLGRGSVLARLEKPVSGFTAVNSSTNGLEPVRTDNLPKAIHVSYSNESPHSYGWRGDSRPSNPPINGEAHAEKRKRSDSTHVETGNVDIERLADEEASSSPKRRMMNNIDSAIDLTSPVQPAQVQSSFPADQQTSAEPRHVPAELRELSPTSRHGKGGTMPSPHPEVVQDMTDSLRRAMKTAQEREAQIQETKAKAQRAEARAQAQREAEQVDAEMRPEAADEEEDLPNDQYSQPSPPDIDPTSPPQPESSRDDQASKNNSQQDEQDQGTRSRKRNFSNRTKTGCYTCRIRKKKCDEGKPTCNNCFRGSFECQGYGPKPPNFGKPQTVVRQPVALQSKRNGFQSVTESSPFVQQEARREAGRTYSHWGRMPEEPSRAPPTLQPPAAPLEHREGPPQPQRQDNWGRPDLYLPNPPTTRYGPDPRMPPPEWPSQTVLPPPYLHGHPYPPQSSLAPASRFMNSPPELWPLENYKPPTVFGAPRSAGDSNSNGTSHSLRAAALALASGRSVNFTEKTKMLLGQPYRGFDDNELMNDRQSCKSVVEQYNEAARTSSDISPGERARLFRAIVDPTARRQYRERPHGESYNGPKGNVGSQTVVDSPFLCDYGYNVHLGDDVYISAGCVMQDPCEIRIGNRTIIGPNVKFRGVTTSLNTKSRHGAASLLIGGPIEIGEDCFIGSDVIILPFRKIGNGAVVGAGSVVTKDVKPNTVVAGNPAKVIRRIESGPNIDRHHDPDIEEQNQRNLEAMLKSLQDKDRWDS